MILLSLNNASVIGIVKKQLEEVEHIIDIIIDN